jgi:hypothetical protein
MVSMTLNVGESGNIPAGSYCRADLTANTLAHEHKNSAPFQKNPT